MLSNYELYGTDDVPQIPKEIANERIELLNTHLDKLLAVHYLKQDQVLINNVLDAKKHWAKLRDGETI